MWELWGLWGLWGLWELSRLWVHVLVGVCESDCVRGCGAGKTEKWSLWLVETKKLEKNKRKGIEEKEGKMKREGEARKAKKERQK